MTSQENSIQKDISILELMILKITKYFNKSIYISDLIYDLESYLNQLTVVDKEWKKISGQPGWILRLLIL